MFSVPAQKALDLFRPGFDLDEKPIPMDEQTTYTSRINITFRFYREGELSQWLSRRKDRRCDEGTTHPVREDWDLT